MRLLFAYFPNRKFLLPAYFLFISFVVAKPLLSQEVLKNYTIGETVVNSKDEAIPDQFYEGVIEEIIFDEINSILENRGFDKKQKNELLKLVADDQATFMALTENDDLIRDGGEKKTTADRTQAFGGSRFAEELISKNNINNGKIPYTYAKIADDIVFKWINSSKKAKLLESDEFSIIGISVKLDEAQRRIYTSAVLGNYKTLNEGSYLVSNLPIPYTEKTYGLVSLNPSYCKKVIRDENITNLQKGLSVEGNTIYFETDNLRSLKKLIADKKDGLAVDILQKEQFPCSLPNIIDHNLINQGILTKRIYSNKLFKNNLVDPEENTNFFKTQLAVLPEGISNDYELNLVVIKNKSVCRTIAQSFLIEPTGTYVRNIKLLADTVTINSSFVYKPETDSMALSIKIPFENKKYTYQPKDIEPFLKLLNEPKFLIYDIKITAYSSIEGTDNENKMLQQKRAESIKAALEERQNSKIETHIITDYNWIDFQLDIQKTKYNLMDSMTMEEAQEYIRSHNLNKALEPLLAKHRYAQIDMKVIFDISGENEFPYVLKKFQEAIDEDDEIKTLYIQKYIMKQILAYKYKANVINSLEIPENKKYAGLIMNKLWLQNYTQQITNEIFTIGVNNIYQIDPDNEYIAFNNLFLKITEDTIASKDQALALQNQIDRLYYTSLRKETIDGLNIKFQFKLLNFADSVGNDTKLKENCINRIKQIVDINDETLQNALKLVELFIDNNDYKFALKTLEPWVFHPEVTEELLITYVSLCSRYEMQMHNQKFNFAMYRIREMNPQRFCRLLDGDYFSLSVFENQFIKDTYCKYCKSETDISVE